MHSHQSAQRRPKRLPKNPRKTPPAPPKRFQGTTARCLGSEQPRNLDFLRMYCTESRFLEVLRTSQSDPRPAKSDLGSVSREPWGPLKEGSETGTPQKSFLSPGTIWGERAFEPWTLEMGPRLYIDKVLWSADSCFQHSSQTILDHRASDIAIMRYTA